MCRISFGIQPCRIFRFLWMRIRKKEVSQNYTQEDDTWVLNDDISKETRENLNEDFSKAMMMVSAFSEDSEQGQAMVAQNGSFQKEQIH